MKINNVLIHEFYEENEGHIKQLKNEMRNKSMWMLCLGAGVSLSYGLPNWDVLLSKMTARILSCYMSADLTDPICAGLSDVIRTLKNKDIFIKQLRKAFDGDYSKAMSGMNSLESAEYIKEFIRKIVEIPHQYLAEQTLDEQENAILAKLISESCKVKEFEDKKGFTTLDAIIDMMTADGKTKIRTALTYNYDNLLEVKLRNYLKDKNRIGSVQSYVTDDKESLQRNNDETWRVFHIHGRIPVLDDTEESIDGKIILTETSYYSEEQINYSLANALQSYAMNYYNLIYIGFSGSDYSFRRIIKGLDGVQKEKKRYIFFCVDDVVKSVIEAVNHKSVYKNDADAFLKQETDKNLFSKTFINHLLWSKKIYWEKYGLQVIWSTLEELPSVIQDINKVD